MKQSKTKQLPKLYLLTLYGIPHSACPSNISSPFAVHPIEFQFVPHLFSVPVPWVSLCEPPRTTSVHRAVFLSLRTLIPLLPETTYASSRVSFDQSAFPTAPSAPTTTVPLQRDTTSKMAATVPGSPPLRPWVRVSGVQCGCRGRVWSEWWCDLLACGFSVA